jgi:regulator of chromosome condensation
LHHRTGDTEKVVSIAAGSNHMLALTTHGKVFAWGASEQGQLGRKVLERRKVNGTIPERVTFGTRTRKAVVVGAGAYHSFAVDDRGDVWGWGLNNMGQTGTGTTPRLHNMVQTPRKVVGLSRDELKDDVVVEIAGGMHHTLFRTEAGKVYGVGLCNAGQLGLAEDDQSYADRFDRNFVTVPALITFPDDQDPIVQISCGAHNSAAVTAGGALYSWGQGLQSELGIEHEEVRTPQVVVRKEGGSWHTESVSCGGQHTLALLRKKV